MSAETAAILAAIGFVAIAVFQAALALGAPLGRAAWGGGSERLPPKLRVASACAVVIWLFAAAVILGSVGIGPGWLPDGVLRWGPWVLVGVLVLGTIMNAASRSRLERNVWTPVTLVLAAQCFVVARS